jgi:hypothetical protein
MLLYQMALVPLTKKGLSKTPYDGKPQTLVDLIGSEFRERPFDVYSSPVIPKIPSYQVTGREFGRP